MANGRARIPSVLLRETVEASSIDFVLDEHSVQVINQQLDLPAIVDKDAAPMIEFRPRTRQEANRMSIAFRKAGRRLETIGAGLPNEPADETAHGRA